MKLTVRRFLSFLIDTLIVSVLLFPFSLFLVNDSVLSTLDQQFSLFTNQFLSQSISFGCYIEEFSYYIKGSIQEYTSLIILHGTFMLIFFVFVPYFFKGQTIGQKLFDLQMKMNNGNSIQLRALLVRNIIVNGLGYMFIIVFFQFLSSYFYLFIISILGILSIMLVMISGFMVLYKQDHLGLQDFLSKSRIDYIEVKK